MNFKTLFYFLFIFLQNISFVQAQPGIDSLLAALKNPKNDTSKINLLNELAQKYADKNSYDLSLQNANEALKLSKEINYKNGMATALKNCAIIYYYRGNYRAMKEYLMQALPIRKASGTKKQIAGVYSNIGVACWSMGDYVGAQQSYLEALKIAEELKDKDGIATIELNLGILSASREKYDEALTYYFRSLKTHEELGEKKAVANAYSNIANTYHSLNDLKNAYDYNMKALKMREEMGDSNELASSYTNIANVFSAMKEFKKADKYEQKALYIKRKLGDKNGEGLILLNIGEHLAETNRAPEAIAYIENSLALAKETNDLELVRNCYDGLYNAYFKTGKFEQALKNYREFVKAKDSLLNEKNVQKITEAQINYEFEKKQREEELVQKHKDELTQAEAKRQAAIRNFFIAGFALILAIALLIFRSYRQTRKAKSEIEFQKTIIEQKNKDITDSINYAQKIQDAFLPAKEIKYRLFPNAFVYFTPRDILSGDFYWFAEKKGVRFIAAVDCTGHGVPGALMSMIGNRLLNEIVLEKTIRKPSEILFHLHQGVRAALKQHEQQSESRDGMDIALLSFQGENVEFAGAMRPLYLVREAGILEEIKGNKFSIGGLMTQEEYEFTNHSFSAKQGDAFYIFSDGYADQLGGAKGKKLMTKNFKELLLANSNLTMPEQEKILHETFMKWKGNKEQIDDVLVIGVKI
ncbi:MAG: tetratricopeptide repeat protein [Bacteroidetes bacterium]|nr:tetratricopeptide repeat protein [Bacteroidota bacterium]